MPVVAHAGRSNSPPHEPQACVVVGSGARPSGFVGAKMSTDSLIYESVIDLTADGPRRGLLNPPLGSDGEVLRPQPAPATTRERCAKCGSPAVRQGATLCGRCEGAASGAARRRTREGGR